MYVFAFTLVSYKVFNLMSTNIFKPWKSLFNIFFFSQIFSYFQLLQNPIWLSQVNYIWEHQHSIYMFFIFFTFIDIILNLELRLSLLLSIYFMCLRVNFPFYIVIYSFVLLCQEVVIMFRYLFIVPVLSPNYAC